MKRKEILNRWKLAVWVSVIVTLLTIVSFLWPHISQSVLMLVEKTQIRERIAEAEKWENRQEEIEHERAVIAVNLSSIAGSLDKHEGMSVVIDRIFEIANKNSVTIQQLVPGDIKSSNTYLEMPVQLKIAGKYHHFARMINEYETPGYFIQPIELTIKSVKDEHEELQAVLLLRIVRLKLESKITDEDAYSASK